MVAVSVAGAVRLLQRGTGRRTRGAGGRGRLRGGPPGAYPIATGGAPSGRSGARPVRRGDPGEREVRPRRRSAAPRTRPVPRLCPDVVRKAVIAARPVPTRVPWSPPASRRRSGGRRSRLGAPPASATTASVVTAPAAAWSVVIGAFTGVPVRAPARPALPLFSAAAPSPLSAAAVRIGVGAARSAVVGTGGRACRGRAPLSRPRSPLPPIHLDGGVARSARIGGRTALPAVSPGPIPGSPGGGPEGSGSGPGADTCGLRTGNARRPGRISP
jgi:hypothetical protein